MSALYADAKNKVCKQAKGGARGIKKETKHDVCAPSQGEIL